MQISAEELAHYSHSPAHNAVARIDYAMLRSVLSRLPRLPKAGEIETELESVQAEQKADALAAVMDRRDVPGRETPLHLAVRIGDSKLVEMLMAAGADCSLQNARGWSALQEAVCGRKEAIAMIITKYYQPMAWAKWCRRLPRVVSTLHRMKDFYMELTFHFESSVIPFVGRIAPSDTYRIWKKGANLRADMTLAGFDGFRIQRSDRSYLFLGEENVGGGNLLVLNHRKKEVTNAFEGAGIPPSDAEVAQEVAMMSRTSIYRPGIDVTQAVLVPQQTWRRHNRVELVGSWKSKVYDMHNVTVSVRSRKVLGAVADEEDEDEIESVDYCNLLTEEEKQQLEMALRVENMEFTDKSVDDGSPGHKENGHGNQKDGNKDEKGWFSWGRKDGKKRETVVADPDQRVKKAGKSKAIAVAVGEQEDEEGSRSSGRKSSAESEFKKGVRPVLWLAEDFPLETEELLPLLDILANKVKAVRRLRELLTTRLPSGAFPVKMAIPVVPTIKVIVTFTKFEELHGISSKQEQQAGSWFSWIRNSSPSEGQHQQQQQQQEGVDPFTVPSSYAWSDNRSESKKTVVKIKKWSKNTK